MAKNKLIAVVSIIILISTLVLCINFTWVEGYDPEETWQAAYIDLSTYTFQPSQETIVSCSLILHNYGMINVSVYGDFFELESGWSVRWINGLETLTSLDKWTNVTLGVTPSADCYNKSYGIEAIGWWGNYASWVLYAFFNVNGTRTWDNPQCGHNYTYPEHQFITRDLFPYDLYLPIQGKSLPVYFKWTTNETSSRRFYVNFDTQGNGSPSWTIGTPIDLLPNTETVFSMIYLPQIYWGGNFNVTVGISDTEANAYAGIYLDSITQTIVKHCPNGENSPPAALTDQGNAIPDVNGDGTVNMRDIQIDILLFNTNPNSSNWNEKADINGDNTVNMRDINIQIQYFNKHW
jgi:hypothetical protein